MSSKAEISAQQFLPSSIFSLCRLSTALIVYKGKVVSSCVVQIKFAVKMCDQVVPCVHDEIFIVSWGGERDGKGGGGGGGSNQSGLGLIHYNNAYRTAHFIARVKFINGISRVYKMPPPRYR